MVTAPGYEQVVGFPKLDDGTATNQVTSILKHLEGWGIDKKIVGICYDTVNTNTGWKSGIGAQLEQKLNRSLFKFSCRHLLNFPHFSIHSRAATR